CTKRCGNGRCDERRSLGAPVASPAACVPLAASSGAYFSRQWEGYAAMRDAQMLQRAREKLIAMGRRIRSDFDQRTEAISESILATGDVSTVPTHLADFDAEGLEVEVAVGQTEDEMLRSIQKALQRIEEGTYGTCEDCG